MLFSFAYEAAGAASTRHSLRPLRSWRDESCKARAKSRRENASLYPYGCLKIESEITAVALASGGVVGWAKARKRRAHHPSTSATLNGGPASLGPPYDIFAPRNDGGDSSAR